MTHKEDIQPHITSLMEIARDYCSIVRKDEQPSYIQESAFNSNGSTVMYIDEKRLSDEVAEYLHRNSIAVSVIAHYLIELPVPFQDDQFMFYIGLASVFSAGYVEESMRQLVLNPDSSMRKVFIQ